VNPLQCITKHFGTVVEWAALKVSCLDRIDGVAVCDLTFAQPSKDSFLELTRQAMALFKSLDTRRYRRVCRHLHYIANTALLSRGQYGRMLKICRVDCDKHFNAKQPQRNVREFAGTLIHEATHGLLFDKNIPYDKETRERVERLCHLESYRFALHFEPGYSDLFPGPFDSEAYKRSWESSLQTRRVAVWKRFQEAWKSSFPKNARDYQQLGRTHTRKGEYAKAIEDCNKAIQLDPQFAEAYFSRGTAHLRKRDFDSAIADYGQAIQIDPKDARAYLNRAMAYLGKCNYDKALADGDQAISLDPRNALAYVNRATVYLMKRDFDGAIADYDHAIQIDPKNAQAYLNRGTAYLRKLNYETAITDYDQAIQLNPRSDAEYKNLAWILATCPLAAFRDGGKAVEHAKTACVLSEWKSPNALRILAAAYGELGDFENAVKWESQFLGAPDQISKATLNAESRLSLYHAHKPYREVSK
jgi:tetratricopeptide (TPR) repeat protein